ncbi:Kinesin light chain 4, partial [Tetrabaena socialis]
MGPFWSSPTSAWRNSASLAGAAGPPAAEVEGRQGRRGMPTAGLGVTGLGSLASFPFLASLAALPCGPLSGCCCATAAGLPSLPSFASLPFLASLAPFSGCCCCVAAFSSLACLAPFPLGCGLGCCLGGADLGGSCLACLEVQREEGPRVSAGDHQLESAARRKEQGTKTGSSDCKAAQKRLYDAEPLFMQSRNICTSKLGPDHPNTLTVTANLAACLAAQGRHVEALPLYEAELEATKRVQGEEHPDVATSLNHLAACLQCRRPVRVRTHGIFTAGGGALLLSAADPAPVSEALAPYGSTNTTATATTGGAAPAAIPTYDLTLLAPPTCQAAAAQQPQQPQQAAEGGGGCAGVGRLRGAMQGVAYVARRDGVGRAVAELKADLLASLAARVELAVEEAVRAAEAEAEAEAAKEAGAAAPQPPPLLCSAAQLAGGCSLALPRRVMLPW